MRGLKWAPIDQYDLDSNEDYNKYLKRQTQRHMDHKLRKVETNSFFNQQREATFDRDMAFIQKVRPRKVRHKAKSATGRGGNMRFEDAFYIDKSSQSEQNESKQNIENEGQQEKQQVYNYTDFMDTEQDVSEFSGFYEPIKGWESRYDGQQHEANPYNYSWAYGQNVDNDFAGNTQQNCFEQKYNQYQRQFNEQYNESTSIGKPVNTNPQVSKSLALLGFNQYTQFNNLSQEELKVAFYSQVKLWHPDRHAHTNYNSESVDNKRQNGSNEAVGQKSLQEVEHHFKQIKEAYEYLKSYVAI